MYFNIFFLIVVFEYTVHLTDWRLTLALVLRYSRGQHNIKSPLCCFPGRSFQTTVVASKLPATYFLLRELRWAIDCFGCEFLKRVFHPFLVVCVYNVASLYLSWLRESCNYNRLMKTC